jgi:hypothetical protein
MSLEEFLMDKLNPKEERKEVKVNKLQLAILYTFLIITGIILAIPTFVYLIILCIAVIFSVSLISVPYMLANYIERKRK